MDAEVADFVRRRRKGKGGKKFGKGFQSEQDSQPSGWSQQEWQGQGSQSSGWKSSGKSKSKGKKKGEDKGKDGSKGESKGGKDSKYAGAYLKGVNKRTLW